MDFLFYTKFSFTQNILRYLDCDSSQYFNDKLFGYMTRFERKLRKFIYLGMVQLEDKDGSSESLSMKEKKLEEKDLNQLYQLLFVNDEFHKIFAEKVNKKNYVGKKSLIEFLNNSTQSLLWDDLTLDNSSANYSQIFLACKSYRNQVMHSKNTNYEDFERAKKLTKKMIEKLDLEITKMVTVPFTSQQKESLSNSLSHLSDTISSENIVKLSSTLLRLYPWMLSVKDMEDTIKQNGDSLSESLKKLATQTNGLNDLTIPQEVLRKYADIFKQNEN